MNPPTPESTWIHRVTGRTYKALDSFDKCDGDIFLIFMHSDIYGFFNQQCTLDQFYTEFHAVSDVSLSK